MSKNQAAARAVTFCEERSELGVPSEIYPYSAGVVGGLLGGAAMALTALAYGVTSGHGPWYPVNLVAGTVLPRMQALSPQALESFDLPFLVAGLAVHMVTATALGLLFALLLPTLPGRKVVWALIVGPLLWLGATSIVLPSINPLMSHLLDWPSFALANIAYGLVMGLWVEHTPKVRAWK